MFSLFLIVTGRYITNANFNMKRPAFLLFINHRLVHSATIKKAIDQVGATHSQTT